MFKEKILNINLLLEDSDYVIQLLKESEASDEAKKRGLTHKGFGNYGPSDEEYSTHKTVDGELVPIGISTEEKPKYKSKIVDPDKPKEKKKEIDPNFIDNIKRVSGEEYKFSFDKGGKTFVFTLNKQEKRDFISGKPLISIIKTRIKKKEEKKKEKMLQHGKKFKIKDKSTVNKKLPDGEQKK